MFVGGEGEGDGEEGDGLPFHRWGTWGKAVRVARRVLSWLHKIRRRPAPSVWEGERLLLRQMQQEQQRELRQGKASQRRLKLPGLLPFIDEEGILRGKGRLQQVAVLARDVREPIYLPREHAGTRLLIAHIHRNDAKHVGGVNHTLARLHERFWLPKPRQVVFRVLQECVPCRRRLARPCRPGEGLLPTFRVPTPGEDPVAFASTGMDCAGPFRVKRGRAVELHYLLLLTCCKTRAVRLELLSSLSVDALLLALSRAHERGVRPMEIISDNGGNFQAAGHLQGKLWEVLQEQGEAREAAFPQIKWRFNPPYASHWGGVFERLIGATKSALYHALPPMLLFNLEQLQTAFALVEGALNSRPLAYVSGAAEELAPLTPNHFLYGSASRPLYVVPDCSTTSLARRWLQVQEAGSHFWQRLQREIRPYLQARSKQCTATQRDLQPGDVVTFLHPEERGRWPLAVVERTLPGRDGKVRLVEIRLPQVGGRGREYLRHPNKLFRRDVGAVALLLPAAHAQ